MKKIKDKKKKYLQNQRRQHKGGALKRQRKKKSQYLKATGQFRPPKITYKAAPSKGWRRTRLIFSYFFRNLFVFLVYRVLVVYGWITGKRRKQAIKQPHTRATQGFK